MKFGSLGDWDRAVRITAGALLLYAGWGGVSTGVVGYVVALAGVLALVTGIAGWCPAYAVCRITTRTAADDDCAACGPGPNDGGAAWRR